MEDVIKQNPNDTDAAYILCPCRGAIDSSFDIMRSFINHHNTLSRFV
jgi:hypothetical protein